MMLRGCAQWFFVIPDFSASDTNRSIVIDVCQLILYVEAWPFWDKYQLLLWSLDLSSSTTILSKCLFAQYIFLQNPNKRKVVQSTTMPEYTYRAVRVTVEHSVNCLLYVVRDFLRATLKFCMFILTFTMKQVMRKQLHRKCVWDEKSSLQGLLLFLSACFWMNYITAVWCIL